MRERITIRVPATTANMGPGFDCLGMALDIWNTIRVEVGSSGFEVVGQGAETLSGGAENLVYQSFCIPFTESHGRVPSVRITCWNEIPLGRGLGSSAAAVVGGLVAGNELCGRPLDRQRLLELAAAKENHPDNVAPALLGGCQIVVWERQRLIASAVAIPEDLKAVLFVPDLAMPTQEARDLLPAEVAREDAVYNMGRVAMLVRAFLTGDTTYLAVATGDRLHQPARQTIFPAMNNIIRAALGAGALGAFLSGAGSSILALTRGREATIGYEMADAAAKSRIDGTIKVTEPTNKGAYAVGDS